MSRIVADYATPWRLLMLVLLGAGLLLAVLLEHPAGKVLGIALAALAIFTLLAQINKRIGTVPSGRLVIAEATPPVLPTRVPSRLSPPIVSVVIPGKNESAFAPDCIRSLQAQTLENFEAVIIDDASTDATLEVLFEAIGDDPRFRIIRTGRSVGIGLARNHGVAVSSAKYLTFLDLDDFLAPNALASRVDLAEQHSDQPWVAGSYCWHEPVDADATPETWVPGPVVGRGTTVSWLGHYDDNFFIASAPLIRRDAFESVGGFDDSPTAEDIVFWMKLLRAGFTIVGTGAVGIGYRQKPTSHAVATAVAMRDTIATLLAQRSEPMPAPPRQAGPFFFSEDLGRYRAAVGFTRRTAAALGIAVADGSSAAIAERLVEDLRSVPYPIPGWGVDIGELAIAAARRVTRPRRERAREGPIVREIARLTNPLIEEATRRAGAWLEAPRSHVSTGPVPARPVRKPKLLPVTPASLNAFLTGRPLLLLPTAGYHTDELIELVDEMKRRGLAPVAMLDDKHWATTGTQLTRVDVPALKALEPGEWLHEFEALLTFNDWAGYWGEYLTYVRGARTVSFGKVEGVQDWLDHDTGRARNAYLASDVVLCQGNNDVRALEGRRGRLEVVGSSRLEAVWNDPLPADSSPRVVGNVNFTYGVQTEHRDLWVDTVRQACERARVPLDLSLHPAESGTYRAYASPHPLRHLVVTDSILVSRFSTVLFEGMARGCSVIYYNPHGEQVPTFKEPNGAFDVAEDPETLSELIRASTKRKRAEARERARDFFMEQVSIVDGTSPAMRTADAIERNLGARG